MEPSDRRSIPVGTVVLGLVGTLVIVLGGSLAGAAAPGSSGRLWSVPTVPVRPRIDLVVALSLFYGGMIVLVRSWFRLRRLVLGRGLSAGLVVVVAVVWALPFLIGPPLGSRDVYAYGAQGRLAAEGIDVFSEGPAALGENPVLDPVDPLYLDAPVVYGPVFVALSSEVAERTGDGVVASVLAYRLIAVLGSRDVYAYGAQGRLAAEGIDVFSEGPAALGESPVLDPVDPLYLDAPVVYGPVFVALSSEVAERTGDGVVASVLAYRLIAVLGLAVATAAVWDLTRSMGRNTADAMVLTIANPLVLLHLVSGAHNEALMLAFLMSGLAIGSRPRYRHVGIALCAFAATIKVPALVGAVFLAWPWIVAAAGWRRRLARLLVSGAEILAVITLATRSTPWGWGWVDALIDASPVDAYLSVTRILGGAVHLATGFEAGSVLAVARLTGVAIAAFLVLALLLNRRGSGLVGLAWALLLIAVLHPTTQPWYLTWGLLLMAAATAGDRNRGFVMGCAAAAFVVLPVGPQLGLVLLESSTIVSIMLATAGLAVLTFSPRSRSIPEIRTGLHAEGITVLVPTRNERANVAALVDAVGAATESLRRQGRSIDVLFVDDSDDDTPEVVRSTAATAPIDVAVLHRPAGARWGGLGGAVVDGLAVASGRTAVVIDGDLQHPPSVIPRLVAQCDAGVDVAVASRRIPGGSDGIGLSPARRWLSVVIGGVVRLLFPTRVRRVADPLSGCFAVTVDSLDLALLQPDGFKILVELLATHPGLVVAEVPYEFRGRNEGVSKATWRQGLTLVGHLADLRLRTSRPWAGAPTPIRSDGSGRVVPELVRVRQPV